MAKKENLGWKKLISDYPCYEYEGAFSLPAYSEFMPPPRVGLSSLGEIDNTVFSESDLYGWNITEIEEEYELRPGLDYVGKQIIGHLHNLGKGLPEHHIIGHNGENIENNPYWPQELVEAAGKLEHEKYVTILPLMLSRTQDDKGRINWTFFGSSIHGPEKAFWNSFFTNPEKEISENESEEFFIKLLTNAYGEKFTKKSSLQTKNFAILPTEENSILPRWTKPYILSDNSSFSKVNYLLTFKPFAQLPEQVRKLYLSGKLALLPFPGSLVYWGMPTYRNLQNQFPLAMQIPVMRWVTRNRGRGGLRVTQSGWIQEQNNGNSIHAKKELLHDTFSRTNRWQRIQRQDDELTYQLQVAKITKVLFSTELDSMGLYDKPMARNCQIWTKNFELVLDGPKATHEEIHKAENQLLKGGLFGYRFFYPPMQVGLNEVYWHRPLVGYISAQSNEIEIMTDGLTGYFTAYHRDDKEMKNPVELWPRILRRDIYLSALKNFETKHDHHVHQTALNILSILDGWEKAGHKLLPRSYALRLTHLAKNETLEQWLDSLPMHSTNEEAAKIMRAELEKMIEPEYANLPEAITFAETANRQFEENWWNTIKFFAHGEFVNKDNADCVQDEETKNQLKHKQRDLEKIGDYLIDYHNKLIADNGMKGKAVCGELPFIWQTDFAFNGFGGWKRNQDGNTYERNILVVIPGKNRKEAVIMADHYDTAYMEDVYDKETGGSGARLSANGADDNFSATATLMLAAPVFLKLAKEGKLERDIWLLHLTGEEFPADCLGARNFCKSLIEKTLRLQVDKKKTVELFNTEIVGVYVLDMIGHNKESDQDIYQISPGKSQNSLKLAYQAHIANMIWNDSVAKWNKTEERKNCKRGKRSSDGITIPEIADFIKVEGDIRNHYDPHSSLFNTDGQIFSDIGAPIVLFMENYDISRHGYHDQFDTLENIDLDFGSAIAAIAIETVARTATLKKIDYKI